MSPPLALHLKRYRFRYIYDLVRWSVWWVVPWYEYFIRSTSTGTTPNCWSLSQLSRARLRLLNLSWNARWVLLKRFMFICLLSTFKLGNSPQERWSKMTLSKVTAKNDPESTRVNPSQAWLNDWNLRYFESSMVSSNSGSLSASGCGEVLSRRLSLPRDRKLNP